MIRLWLVITKSKHKKKEKKKKNPEMFIDINQKKV